MITFVFAFLFDMNVLFFSADIKSLDFKHDTSQDLMLSLDFRDLIDIHKSTFQ